MMNNEHPKKEPLRLLIMIAYAGVEITNGSFGQFAKKYTMSFYLSTGKLTPYF